MSISSIVNLVAGKIGELLVQEAKLLYGVKDEVGSLQEELTMMQSYLIDMEVVDEEGGNDERTRTIIQQIRKIAYDAEDVIESYIVEADLSTAEKANLFERYFCFCSSLPRTHQIGSDIVAIKARIVETRERWIRYSGGTGVGRRSSHTRQGRVKRNRPVIRPTAYSHSIEDHVVGLDEDIKKLVKVLTVDENHHNKSIQVVSFVGMGGSGKTTLARKLYKHGSVIEHFDCVAWVSISQQCVVKQILLDLLQKIGAVATNEDSSHILTEKLHECLERKRSLIVLDDVWEKEVLEHILPAFPLRSDRGKIIVTTRNQNVLDFPNIRCLTHEPRRLTGEESWELFRKIALIQGGSTLDINHVLEALGKDMLKKCNGLPLAVIALAGILGKKESVEEWEKIKKAVSSRIMEDGGGTHLYGPVSEMLALSYYDLPRHLKPCFLYLAMFPEDYEIRVGQLIKMWIAEGFISSDELLHEGSTLEDLAQEYVDELVQRCIVQVAHRDYQGKAKRICVHDLVRDLCIKKAKEVDFLEVSYLESPNPDKIVKDSRRTAIYYHDRLDFHLVTQNRHLRSLLCEGDFSRLKDLFIIRDMNCRLLRVLLLQHVDIDSDSLPIEIGRLIHLRYLGLRSTPIFNLPSSIRKLRNLLTLDYRQVNPKYGNREVRIPDVVWEIEGLTHLYLPYDCGMTINNLRLDTLNKLQTLSGGTLGGDWVLKELPRLSSSVQKLFIRGITSQNHLEAVFQCPSIRSDSLRSLEMHWFDTETHPPNLGMEVENLGPIIHCQRLKKLKLKGPIREGLQGIQFPACITMLRLERTGFSEKATLVALGKLPHLTKLVLKHFAYTGKNWDCCVGEFAKLEQLTVEYFLYLEKWSIDRGAMPQLRILEISHCEKLKIPKGLRFITTLQELRLHDMSDELEKRLRGNDAHIIQHVPLVKIWTSGPLG